MDINGRIWETGHGVWYDPSDELGSSQTSSLGAPPRGQRFAGWLIRNLRIRRVL